MQKREKESPFETLNSRKIHTGHFSVVQDLVRVNGNVQIYDYVDVREGVCILAVHEGRFLVQKQYRYPVRSWQWELPGGFVDEGETPEEAAVRELKEETGYGVREIHSLGAFYPSFGSTTERIYLFLAECGEAGKPDKEPGEAIFSQELTREEFQELIASGEFMHGAGLAAWTRYCLSKNGNLR